MEDYVFVCVGTNKLIEDSFGPMVGDLLTCNFYKYPHIKVLGTMKKPVHFNNAPIFLDYLKCNKSKIILIDSALGKYEDIGNTYINLGGTEIGKAFGKSYYFPANFNIKTVVGVQEENHLGKSRIKNFEKKRSLEQIRKMAQKVAQQVTSIAYETNLIKGL